MGLRSRTLSLVVAFVLLVAPQLARAETSETPPATQTASAPTCGKTIDEKLAAAQNAFETNDAALRPAFACLLRATIALNDRQHELERGRPTSGNLQANKIPYVATITNLSGTPITPGQ